MHLNWSLRVSVVTPTMAATATSKCDRVKPFKAVSFLMIKNALTRGSFVSRLIITIRVCQVFLPEMRHLDPLCWRNATRDRPNSRCIITLLRTFDGIDSTTMKNEVGELGNIWSIPIIYFVLASVSGPGRGIPYCRIQWHRFGRKIALHCCGSPYLPNGNTIHIKSEIMDWKTYNKTSK